MLISLMVRRPRPLLTSDGMVILRLYALSNRGRLRTHIALQDV